MEAKLTKLKKAAAESETEMLKAKEAYIDSEKRLTAAKDLLRKMDSDDQKKIMINDTKLPELLELHAAAKDQYEMSEKRYATNMKYVKMIEDKIRT
jgi:hypothetical protein